MRLMQPLPGGTIDGARAHLVDAQGFAANVANAPEHLKAAEFLTEGIKSAKRAAAELFIAQPRSDFQDLVAARHHVLEGAMYLEHASNELYRTGGVDPLPQVKLLAGNAFDSFEAAFEILDNS